MFARPSQAVEALCGVLAKVPRCAKALAEAACEAEAPLIAELYCVIEVVLVAETLADSLRWAKGRCDALARAPPFFSCVLGPPSRVGDAPPLAEPARSGKEALLFAQVPGPAWYAPRDDLSWLPPPGVRLLLGMKWWSTPPNQAGDAFDPVAREQVAVTPEDVATSVVAFG